MSTPVVTFDFPTFTVLFPEFANVNPTTAAGWFLRASFLCGNETCNPLNGVTGMLSMALYLLTAHIGWLNAPRDAAGNPAATGVAPSPLVGRIDQATEGSVSVHADMGDANSAFPTQAWFNSTKYGAEYVLMTAGIRTAHYVAQPTIVPGPVYPGLYGRFY